MNQSPPKYDGSDEDCSRYELALHASNEGIWDWHVHEDAIYYSQRILEFLECTDSAPPNLFRPPHGIVHHQDLQVFTTALAEALADNGPELLKIDCRILTSSNNSRWLRIRGTIVRDSTGKTTRIAGSIIDISRRKLAESQVKDEQHLLSTLIENIPLQVYFKDLESRFVLCNQQMAEWNGKTDISEVIGAHDRDMFTDAHWKDAAEDERKIMETRTPITGKLEQEGREGLGDTWVLTSKFPWTDPLGNLKGTFGVSSDVTELVEAQQQAASLAEELSERNTIYEEELQLAREIQQALASSQFPDISTQTTKLQFGSRYLPISGLAGDFFETIQISENVVGLLICDVMGHGVRSALIVAMLRGLLEKQQFSAANPSNYLAGLNRGLASILTRADATMFATAFYAVIDIEKGTLESACAGHPSAICISKDNSITQLNSKRPQRGPGLGLVANANFPSEQISLDQVDRLLLFTDGLLEAEDETGEQFLEKRLIKQIQTRNTGNIEEMLDDLVSAVLEFSENHQFEDDVCILGMEILRKTASPSKDTATPKPAPTSTPRSNNP